MKVNKLSEIIKTRTFSIIWFKLIRPWFENSHNLKYQTFSHECLNEEIKIYFSMHWDYHIKYDKIVIKRFGWTLFNELANNEISKKSFIVLLLLIYSLIFAVVAFYKLKWITGPSVLSAVRNRFVVLINQVNLLFFFCLFAWMCTIWTFWILLYIKLNSHYTYLLLLINVPLFHCFVAVFFFAGLASKKSDCIIFICLSCFSDFNSIYVIACWKFLIEKVEFLFIVCVERRKSTKYSNDSTFIIMFK